jgi:hypothetical protein
LLALASFAIAVTRYFAAPSEKRKVNSPLTFVKSEPTFLAVPSPEILSISTRAPPMLLSFRSKTLPLTMTCVPWSGVKKRRLPKSRILFFSISTLYLSLRRNRFCQKQYCKRPV